MLGFAIGCLHSWVKDDNRASLLDYPRKLNLRAVEITLGPMNEFNAFNPSKKQLKWLHSLDYVSLHAPFRTRGLDLDMIATKTKKIFDLVNAKTVIVHANNISMIDAFYKRMPISIEHMEVRRNISLKDFKKIVDKYPKASICMDVSHNYTHSVNETKHMLNLFGNRIKEIHFSGSKYKKTHTTMANSPRAFFKSIKPLIKTDIPIIIEEDCPKSTFSWLKSEVNTIRNLLQLK